MDKVQYPFMVKALDRVDLEGTHLNIIKAMYEKPTVNTILNGEKLRTFLPQSGIRKDVKKAIEIKNLQF